MIYEHFAMRLHGASTWTIQIGNGLLEKFEVGSVSNPAPEVKTSDINIAGTSGRIDYTENPRVSFDNKNVAVVLQGFANGVDMVAIENALCVYQGRMVDISFDEYKAFYQVGRMVLSVDKYRNKVFLTINCTPFRYSVTNARNLEIRDNYEESVNTNSWSTSVIGAGEILVKTDNVSSFAISASKADVEIKREKTVSYSDGTILAVGVSNIVGGDIWFEYDDNGITRRSKTFATVSGGKIAMHILVDGSNYEWKTVNNARVYLPTIRCFYILTDSVGEDGVLDDQTYIYADSNVDIRPQIVNSTNYDAVLICEGIAIDVPAKHIGHLPRFEIPSMRSDYSNLSDKRICVFVPKTSSENPRLLMSWTQKEVF